MNQVIALSLPTFKRTPPFLEEKSIGCWFLKG